jgi:hypothetical protein
MTFANVEESTTPTFVNNHTENPDRDNISGKTTEQNDENNYNCTYLETTTLKDYSPKQSNEKSVQTIQDGCTTYKDFPEYNYYTTFLRITPYFNRCTWLNNKHTFNHNCNQNKTCGSFKYMCARLTIC